MFVLNNVSCSGTAGCTDRPVATMNAQCHTVPIVHIRHLLAAALNGACAGQFLLFKGLSAACDECVTVGGCSCSSDATPM